MFDANFLIDSVALVVKLAIVFLIGVHLAAGMSWLERRQLAYTQRRLGPNRVGIFKWRLMGLGQPIADTLKLLFKEDFFPARAHRFFYFMAPVIVSLMAYLALLGIPLSGPVSVLGRQIDLRVLHLNVGFLYILAMAGLSVYGIVLAGWSSNNKYALLGGLRAAAQMISYEIALGLSLIPIVLAYGTLDLNEIVLAQGNGMWGVIYAPISCMVFIVAIFAETNRIPFDLAEGEAELVAGFLVEYGSMRWSQFFLGEYTMMFTLSALAVCLFFGGYQLPLIPHSEVIRFFERFVVGEPATWLAALVGFTVLLVKVGLMLLLFVQARCTLPRFRYDQLMSLGWRRLFPLALANVAITAIVLSIVRGFGAE